jgi:SPFH domain / Band 7 family
MGQIKDLIEYIFNIVKIWIIVQPWQQGIRVRKGTKIKKLSNGLYFRIPYLDSVYIQETRLRMVQMNLQTLTSKDGKTITINSSLGYSIYDIEKLYTTLYHPEGTVMNIASAVVSEYVYNNYAADITPLLIEAEVMKTLNAEDYGLHFKLFKITNFAEVRTFRLIQDNQTWVDTSSDLSKKS